ncbi:MAG: divalent metal cation transporter [Chloroflexi bacterium]|nr:MAG: divalent metal cation transporter [Chloroflexota bacterium]
MANSVVTSHAHDSATVVEAQRVLQGQSDKKWFARLLPFIGPAFIASIAYVDPGNFATNIAAGAQFGYLLLWVIFASNLMAMLIQSLSAKLGIATGKNLAEICRQEFPRPVVLGMWVLMEVMVIATDVAEFLGAAVGMNLLFHIPLFPAALITAAATFVILSLERRGFRHLEAVITVFVGVIALCYVIEIFLVNPNWAQVAYHSVVPHFDGAESVLLAAGILGATVMPHVIFLHSALTQGRIVTREPQQMKRLYRFELVDVVAAMGTAGLVNAAMLIASVVFAISLLASGLSSSTVGTMAGQVIMQGFLHRKISVWLRRLLTIIPTLIIIALGFDPTQTLIISQVVLSFALPFAVIPLVMFTRRRNLMGVLTNHRLTTLTACVVAALIIALNMFLLYQTFFGV